MSRWVIAIALSWSTWAVQQPAVAHARSPLGSEIGTMCGEGAQTVLPEELVLGRALSMAPKEKALSASITPPLSAAGAEERAAARLAASGLRAAGTQDDGPPAWCISPDDPRCAPHDQGAPLPGPRALVPMQDVAAMRWPELAAASGAANLCPEQRGAPRAGVGLRIERPPRSL